MKKTVIILMLLALVSCGKEEVKTPNKPVVKENKEKVNQEKKSFKEIDPKKMFDESQLK